MGKRCYGKILEEFGLFGLEQCVASQALGAARSLASSGHLAYLLPLDSQGPTLLSGLPCLDTEIKGRGCPQAKGVSKARSSCCWGTWPPLGPDLLQWHAGREEKKA